MSKNKKSMKNSKKRINNYKIESLEPRLMMDASMDGWKNEAALASDAVLTSDVSSLVGEWKNSFVETLQRKVNNKGDYEQCKVGHLLDKGQFNGVFTSSGSVIKNDFRNALFETVQDWLAKQNIDLSKEINSERAKHKSLFGEWSTADVATKSAKLQNLVKDTLRGTDLLALDLVLNQDLFSSSVSASNVKTLFNNFVDAVKKIVV